MVIRKYFTFHNFSDSLKCITAVFFSLVLVSGTKCDLLLYESVPDFIRASWIYFFLKCFATVVLLRILSQTEFPFRAIDDLVFSVRDRFTRNEPEYPGFTLRVQDFAETVLPKSDLDYCFSIPCSRAVQSKPLMVFTIHNLMKQVLCIQIPAFHLYKAQKEYFMIFVYRLIRVLKFYFNSLPCHPDCLDILNRPSEYQFQHEADRNKSPFQLLFSRLEYGLSLTESRYTSQRELDRDVALLRAFLIVYLEFRLLSWYDSCDSQLPVTTVAHYSWKNANRFYAEVCKVSLDLEATLQIPWLRRVIYALFKKSGHTILRIDSSDTIEYVMYVRTILIPSRVRINQR